MGAGTGATETALCKTLRESSLSRMVSGGPYRARCHHCRPRDAYWMLGAVTSSRRRSRGNAFIGGLATPDRLVVQCGHADAVVHRAAGARPWCNPVIRNRAIAVTDPRIVK